MIELQRKLMGDDVRNQAFYEALKKVIKPGMTVSDIGSGTGFLSFLAMQLGAKKCYLYELSSDLIGISKQLAKRNKIHGCEFIHAHAHMMKKPVQTDIVISETLGNYALEEHLIENMEDAKRFLKPGGVMIPQTLVHKIVPVTGGRLKKNVDIWHDIGFDLAWDEARDISINNMYVKTVDPKDLLSKDAVKTWDTLNFTKHEKSQRRGEVSWIFDKPATVNGFCVFWESGLVPGVTLSTSPWEKPTHWEQIYLPLHTSVDIQKGEALKAVLTSDTRFETGVRLTWEATVIGSNGKVRSTQKLDMQKGYIE